jgi:hypothetical protein
MRKRIESHEAIINTVYAVHESLPDIFTVDIELRGIASEVIYDNISAATKKNGESIENNSLWADVDVLNFVGAYRFILVGFMLEAGRAGKDISDERKKEITETFNKTVNNLMQKARETSGVVFLNRGMQKLIK